RRGTTAPWTNTLPPPQSAAGSLETIMSRMGSFGVAPGAWRLLFVAFPASDSLPPRRTMQLLPTLPRARPFRSLQLLPQPLLLCCALRLPAALPEELRSAAAANAQLKGRKGG
ncbi:Hypothetical predicted protein, partial [Podarcis lilfordi]